MLKKILTSVASVAAFTFSLSASANEITQGPTVEEVQRIIARASTADGYQVYESKSKKTWWYVNLRLPSANKSNVSGNVPNVLARCRVEEDGIARCEGFLHNFPVGKPTASR